MDTSPHFIRPATRRPRTPAALLRIAIPTVIVTFGVATAAWAAITGADIASGTIVGRNIKSGSITGRHVRTGAIARSDLAISERSDAYERIGGNTVNLSLVSFAELTSRSLPAGNWLLIGSSQLINTDVGSPTADCFLRTATPDASIAERYVPLGDAGTSASYKLLQITTTISLSSASTVKLGCIGSAKVIGVENQLIAVRIGSLTRSGTWPFIT